MVNAVDKAALETLLSSANATLATAKSSDDGTDISPSSKWVSTEIYAALTDAIADAQSVYDNSDASKSEVDFAKSGLSAAISSFNNAKQNGTMVNAVDKAALETLLSSANATLATAKSSDDGTDISPSSKWVSLKFMPHSPMPLPMLRAFTIIQMHRNLR
ncbi:hypothetical protein [Candidatus Epulonipiscium viviparus]|uniref:hypothetical protein n=1 Tax=Candidatus Epulonipiscium viviparus TaxID=420336 RepID=UPI0027380719|nr:hypothetical protein [Candidatus Epulopiscium viviparus]